MQDNRHQPDYVLFFTVVILCSIGIVTVFSASTFTALDHGMSASYFAKRQLFYGVAGFLLMVGLIRVRPQRWYKLAAPLMLLNIPLLVAVKLVGHSELGGQRWIGTGSFHLQPSEIAIISTSMYLAFFFTKKVTVIRDFKRGLRPALMIIALNFLLIIIEPDMGTALTLFATSLVILFASGAPLGKLFKFLGAATPILVGLAFMQKYRLRRLIAFVDAFNLQNQSTVAYQLIQGWTAISAGGWFGRGFGMSLQKTGYLPMSDSDFIFPIFVEEWGYVGAIALLATYGVLIWRGFRIARHASDRFSALFAAGLTSMITVGAIINLGAVSGLLPVTGIPLPFISLGGTALVVNMAAMGILLSISCYTLDEAPEADQLAEVVDVEHARDRRATESDDFTGLDKLPRKPRRRRPAVVQPLRPVAKKQPPPASTWRSRQEVAASRQSTRRTSKQKPAAVESTRTWRERSQMSGSSRKGTSPNKRSTQKKGVFRKDR